MPTSVGSSKQRHAQRRVLAATHGQSEKKTPVVFSDKSYTARSLRSDGNPDNSRQRPDPYRPGALARRCSWFFRLAKPYPCACSIAQLLRKIVRPKSVSGRRSIRERPPAQPASGLDGSGIPLTRRLSLPRPSSAPYRLLQRRAVIQDRPVGIQRSAAG